MRREDEAVGRVREMGEEELERVRERERGGGGSKCE